jgi:autotransporter-associated beta strand protein
MKPSYNNVRSWASSPRWRVALVCCGAASLAFLGNASANIIYSGEQNIAIPQDFTGVFINVTNFQNSTSASSTWDLNPFFGGSGIANAPSFQPVRIGTGNEDSILALGLGSSIGSSSAFSTDWGGSGAEGDSGHIGPAPSQFTSGQIGYLGFKLIHEATVNYGWMRVNLTQNGATGSILDWAYDSTGVSILTGAVADLGEAPLILNAASKQTLSASGAGTGILMEPGAQLTFSEGSDGGTYTGSIQGEGEIRVDGAGGLRLTGANPFSGIALVLEGSRLTVGEAKNLGRAQISIGTSAFLVFNSLATNNGSANTFANDIRLNGQTANLNNSGSGMVTLSGTIDSNGGLLSFSGGSFDVLGSISGSGSLRMEGAGTLTLSGNNTHTGNTTVSTGTLVIASGGSIASSSGIIMGANTTFDVSAVSFTLGEFNPQTLSGGGTIAGHFTIGASGILAIGASPGTMTFANDLGLDADSISNFEINGFTLGNYDLAIAASEGIQTVRFNGGILNLLFQTGFSTLGAVKIFDFDIYDVGSGFTSVNTSGLASGYSAFFDNSNGVVTVIPEPSAALLGGFGLLSLLLLCRRRHSTGD